MRWLVPILIVAAVGCTDSGDPANYRAFIVNGDEGRAYECVTMPYSDTATPLDCFPITTTTTTDNTDTTEGSDQ